MIVRKIFKSQSTTINQNSKAKNIAHLISWSTKQYNHCQPPSHHKQYSSHSASFNNIIYNIAIFKNDWDDDDVDVYADISLCMSHILLITIPSYFVWVRSFVVAFLFSCVLFYEHTTKKENNNKTKSTVSKLQY